MNEIMSPAGDCEICGRPIPWKPGIPAKTCSPDCRAERNNRREKKRYRKVKDTAHWKEVRADYLARLKQKLARDPEFAVIFRAHRAANTREWKRRIDSDPKRRAQMLTAKRAAMARWREQLMSDPAAWDAHKEKARAWYRSLSDEDRQRIFRRKK